MRVEDLLKIDGVKLVNDVSILSTEINNIYISDLLSWVMGHVREEGVCFLTILNSINIIAVASLLEMSAVVFCEGVIPSKEVIDKATEEKIPLFSTSLSTAQLAKEIYKYENIL